VNPLACVYFPILTSFHQDQVMVAVYIDTLKFCSVICWYWMWIASLLK